MTVLEDLAAQDAQDAEAYRLLAEQNRRMRIALGWLIEGEGTWVPTAVANVARNALGAS